MIGKDLPEYPDYRDRKDIPSYPLPKALYFSPPTADATGTRTTRILPHPTAQTPFLVVKQGGKPGHVSFQVADAISNTQADFLYGFSHGKIKTVSNTVDWDIVGGRGTDATPTSVRGFPCVVHASGTQGAFTNPFQPEHKFRWVKTSNSSNVWHMERWLFRPDPNKASSSSSNSSSSSSARRDDGGITNLLNAQMLREVNIKTSPHEHERIAKFEVNKSGAVLTVLQEESVWKSLEECGFVAGTAVAISVGELSGGGGLTTDVAILAGMLACSIM